MKLTKSKLKQLIKEEMSMRETPVPKSRGVHEAPPDPGYEPQYALRDMSQHVKQLYARIETLEARLEKAGLA